MMDTSWFVVTRMQIIDMIIIRIGLFSGVLLFTWLATRFILRLHALSRLRTQKAIFFEIQPPAASSKTTQATEQLFSVLHSLGGTHSLLSRLTRPPVVISLEVVSTRKKGIRYIVRVPEDKSLLLQQAIITHLPEVRVQEVADSLPPTTNPQHTLVTNFVQKAHFAYPLKHNASLTFHDPIAYLTGSMTKLGDDELVAFQMVISPVKVRQVRTLSRRILKNEDLLPRLHTSRLSRFQFIWHPLNVLILGAIGVVSDIFHGVSREGGHRQGQSLQRRQSPISMQPARILSNFEQEMMSSINHKLGQPLFRTDIRLLVMAQDKQTARRRTNGIESALASYSTPGYQALEARRAILVLTKSYNLSLWLKRLPALFHYNSTLLSVSEVGGLYHFPNSETNKTENIVKSLSRALPAPVAHKSGIAPDIILGANHYHGSITPIGLTAAERERHVYVIGGTGNGKTTMLLSAIVQDIQKGKGVAVIDPHGDLAETILRHIPTSRLDDVIYFNPDDLEYPISLNPLELPEGLSGDDLLREKDLITESIISVLRKVFSDNDSGGHRIEYVLRNTIHTALTVEGATLFTIFRLLTDNKYRRVVTAKLEDQDLQNFWKNEVGQAGDFQRIKMSSGITAKIGRFLFSASARKALEQPKSTVKLEEVLDTQKIIICNFSKGLLGDDTSTLFGTVMLARLQIAALRRARQSLHDRKPFFVYVDEFQNFATTTFIQMLSEARKYKLFLVMAEQSTAQQAEQRVVDIILANAGIVVCFRTGSPRDEQRLLPLFSPYIEMGEISNLDAFNFYIKIAATKAREPLSGQTLLLENNGSGSIAAEVIQQSRNSFTHKAAVAASGVGAGQSGARPGLPPREGGQPDAAGGDKTDAPGDVNQFDGSRLFDEQSFYDVFYDDLKGAKNEVIIESPFLSRKRVSEILPIILKLVGNGVAVHINTRTPKHYEEDRQKQVSADIKRLKNVGAKVRIWRDRRHFKIAAIDSHILWEGSLNILSQKNSRELMRRTESSALCLQMLRELT